MMTSGNKLSRTGYFGWMMVGLGGYWLFRYAGVPFETMLVAVLAIGFAMVIGCPLGLLVGYLMSRDGDVDTRTYRIIAWANVFAWVVPVIGMCLSSVSWQFSRRSDNSPRLYYTLSTIGGLLAMISAAIGGGLEYSAQASSRSEAQAEPVRPASSPGERSPERCAYAAIEAWPNEDFEKYCRGQ